MRTFRSGLPVANTLSSSRPAFRLRLVLRRASRQISAAVLGGDAPAPFLASAQGSLRGGLVHGGSAGCARRRSRGRQPTFRCAFAACPVVDREYEPSPSAASGEGCHGADPGKAGRQEALRQRRKRDGFWSSARLGSTRGPDWMGCGPFFTGATAGARLQPTEVESTIHVAS